MSSKPSTVKKKKRRPKNAGKENAGMVVPWTSVTYLNFKTLKQNDSWALVAHICNPCYSGGRYQEDHSLKPAGANSS
jgi:hypothetical protein